MIESGVRYEVAQEMEIQQQQQACEVGRKGVSSHPGSTEDRRVEDRTRAERLALEKKMEACASKQEFQAAADLQKQLESLPTVGLLAFFQWGAEVVE